MVNEDKFEAYKTLLNKDLGDYDYEQFQQLRTVDYILMNYLFFVDDKRVIYLSEDDEREDIKNLGNIKLVYKEVEAELEEYDRLSYKQAIRGYYTVEGDRIQFHFKGKKDFYIKATHDGVNEVIRLDSISIRKEKNVIDESLKNRNKAFTSIFNKGAQPIFEFPNVYDDIVHIDQEYTLNFGIEEIENLNPKLRMIKENLLELSPVLRNPYIDPNCPYEVIIDSIYYRYSKEEDNYFRHYLYHVDCEDDGQYEIVEDLNQPFSW